MASSSSPRVEEEVITGVPDPRQMSDEEKKSYKKALMAKIHFDYPEFDWLMADSLVETYLRDPDVTPEKLLAKYDPDIFKPDYDQEKKKKDQASSSS